VFPDAFSLALSSSTFRAELMTAIVASDTGLMTLKHVADSNNEVKVGNISTLTNDYK